MDQYRAGARTVKDQLHSFDSRPIQKVENKLSYATVGADEGTMKLLASYIEEYGDPETNGKGHKKTRGEWRDGTIQDIVLIPDMPSDEMRVRFERRQELSHNTVLDDGLVTANPNQQAELFSTLKAPCMSQLTGEAIQRQPFALQDAQMPEPAKEVFGGLEGNEIKSVLAKALGEWTLR